MFNTKLKEEVEKLEKEIRELKYDEVLYKTNIEDLKETIKELTLNHKEFGDLYNMSVTVAIGNKAKFLREYNKAEKDVEVNEQKVQMLKASFADHIELLTKKQELAKEQGYNEGLKEGLNTGKEFVKEILTEANIPVCNKEED